MKNRNLGEKGLTLSKAQSISNLCHQRALDIQHELEKVNNYSETISLDGNDVIIKVGHVVPNNLSELLSEKAKLHACQAFLMENIKLKSHLLDEIKQQKVDVSMIEKPEQPEVFDSIKDKLDFVNENYGWSQLSNKEYNEFLEAEAFASHIGQYIHKNSPLDRLRNELNEVPDVDWIELEKDKKTIVRINKHHTPQLLLNHHEELSKLHRKYEERVNYFKAKVKNITTQRNAEVAKHNAELDANDNKLNNQLLSEYSKLYKEYQNKIKEKTSEFEVFRQNEIKRISQLRIDVDSRFQDIVDMFLKDINTDE